MIEITPLPINKKPSLSLVVPPSKSITQRALIAASLASGESILYNPLSSEDTNHTVAALVHMGLDIDTSDPTQWRIIGNGGNYNRTQNGNSLPTTLFLGNNGTATRFLTSLAALSSGTYIIDGDERMRSRPIAPLVFALQDWGASIRFLQKKDCPPLFIDKSELRGERQRKSYKLTGGRAFLPEGGSSQYLSSLLLIAPYCKNPAIIKPLGRIPSQPYIAMTMAVMNDFGICVDCAEDYSYFRIPQGCYHPKEYHIEGDASSASYFFAAAAISGGEVCVENFSIPSLQGDAMFAALLGRMGCQITMGGTNGETRHGRGIIVSGTERLKGIQVDMSDMPDVVPTLAVVAAFAEGVTEISNIGHLRLKESDRITAVISELRKLGVRAEESKSSMIIYGTAGKEETLHGAEIETYNDHRIAMSFAIAGLRIRGVRILGEECVVKSFPDFWQKFSSFTNFY